MLKKFISIALAFSAAAGLSAPAAFAEEPPDTGSLTIVMTDDDYLPIPDLSISL